jgi:mannan endo-1,6-alpha-mannosidase
VHVPDSIKSAAKSLAGGIVSAYKKQLDEERIPGLFPEPHYWWEAGTVFNSLIEYSHLTGDKQYDALVSEALQWQLGDLDAFMPPNQTKTLGNEDQSTWGLAAMAAAESNFTKPKGEWIKYAQNVFDTQAARFELEEGNATTCNGGLRWQIFSFNNGYDYKETKSNANFFLLSARLARFTGNETYTKWAEKSYTWAKDAGLISNESAVYDGVQVGENNCSDINRIQWTYPHAVYTEGVALLYNLVSQHERTIMHQY